MIFTFSTLSKKKQTNNNKKSNQQDISSCKVKQQLYYNGWNISLRMSLFIFLFIVFNYIFFIRCLLISSIDLQSEHKFTWRHVFFLGSLPSVWDCLSIEFEKPWYNRMPCNITSRALIIAQLSESNKTTAQINSVQYLVFACIIS